MRLTHRTRCLNRTRRQIEAEMKAAIYAELKWLWQQLYPTIRQLRANRDNIQKWHNLNSSIRIEYEYHQRTLTKVNQSLWQTFQSRLNTALQSIIESAAERLSQVESSFWQSRGYDVDLDSKSIVYQYQEQIGREITQISDDTRQKMGEDIAEWYNTPGATTQSLVERLKPHVSESRANTIAMNEVTELNSAVTNTTMTQLGLDEWFWNTMRDELVCSKPLEGPDGQVYNGCRGLHGKRFDTSQPMPPRGSHIGCRCNPVPVVTG